MINLNAWFQKHGLCAENILYIYRKDRKTVIQRTDGAEFALFVPVHSVLSTLPEKNFLSISKGIVVCRSHIVNISNDGVYTMSDGRTFQGRKRDMSSHRRLRAEIELTNTKHRPLSMLEKCSLLDNMPLAFCVIELVFNEDGCGVDFIFRYCNAEMATVEGVPVEEMLNRSFYRVFPNGDKKWLALASASVLVCLDDDQGIYQQAAQNLQQYINASQRPGKKQTDFSDLFVYQEYAHDYEMDEVSTLEEIQEEILRRANDPKYLRLDEKGCSKLLTIIAPE